MQNFNQTESINYQPQQPPQQRSPIENAINFGNEMNNSINDGQLANLDPNSLSDSNFFNNSVDFNNVQNSFSFNDKYLANNSFVDEISQTSMASTCSSQLDDSQTSRHQSMMIKMNSQQNLSNQLKSVPEEDSNQQQSTYQKPNVYSPTSSNSGSVTSKAKLRVS